MNKKRQLWQPWKSVDRILANVKSFNSVSTSFRYLVKYSLCQTISCRWKVNQVGQILQIT